MGAAYYIECSSKTQQVQMIVMYLVIPAVIGSFFD